MICLNLESHDPFFYLALEEVLLKRRNGDYLVFASNDPSVIIGKHQAAHMEINTKFVTENRIPVIRRISGGGTVFHDRGNLNFSFITQSEEGKQVDFRKYTQPVIDFLISLGIQAKFEGKSDIKVSGLKISGNAEHVYRNRVLHHGTLLFSTSVEMLKNSIRTDKSCYTSRAVNSNPASVLNLNGKLKLFSDIDEFRNKMVHYFSENTSDFKVTELSQEDIEESVTLAESRYRSWEWNFAYGPEYIFRNSFMLDGTLHSCFLKIRNGVVVEGTIDGSSKMRSVAERLTGCRHMVYDFMNAFEKENATISREEIFNFF